MMPTYQEQADLINDSKWRPRVDACIRQEAGNFANDERPEYSTLAKEIVHSPTGTDVYAVAAQVATKEPTEEGWSDGDILSAVQDVWPKVGATYVNG